MNNNHGSIISELDRMSMRGIETTLFVICVIHVILI